MAFIQVKKCLTEPKNLIKLIVLIICCCITLYQLTECVRKILYPPVSTYYKFYLNETVKYPAITICRQPAYKLDRFSKYSLSATVPLSATNAFSKFPFDTASIKDFLNEATYALNDLGLYGFQGAFLSNKVQISPRFHLTKGQCQTFLPLENSAKFSIGGGFSFFLKHTAGERKADAYGLSVSGFKIFIHQEDEVVTDEEEQENSFLDYIYLETNEDMHVQLDLQLYTQISSPTDPCVSTPGYSKSKCQEQCIHSQIAEIAGCTLPWLNVPEANYSQCSTYASVRLLNSGFNALNKTHFMKNCNCKMACTVSVYKANILSRREIESGQKPGSSISLYFSSNVITQMEEVIGYDWNIFLSDIGGSLGFLLGLSVIGIITVIEQIVYIFWKKSSPNSKKNQNDKMDEDTMKTIIDCLNDYNKFYEKHQIIDDKKLPIEKTIN